jgi:hypothetical protein
MACAATCGPASAQYYWGDRSSGRQTTCMGNSYPAINALNKMPPMKCNIQIAAKQYQTCNSRRNSRQHPLIDAPQNVGI